MCILIRCLKTSFVIAYAQQLLLLDSHLDILVILALLRASHILNPHLSCISHLNKEICISASRAVVLYPLLQPCLTTERYVYPFQAKYTNARVVSVSQSPCHLSLQLAMSFDSPVLTATTCVGRLQGGSSNLDQTRSCQLGKLCIK